MAVESEHFLNALLVCNQKRDRIHQAQIADRAIQEKVQPSLVKVAIYPDDIE
jgi:hypothetical protein